MLLRLQLLDWLYFQSNYVSSREEREGETNTNTQQQEILQRAISLRSEIDFNRYSVYFRSFLFESVYFQLFLHAV